MEPTKKDLLEVNAKQAEEMNGLTQKIESLTRKLWVADKKVSDLERKNIAYGKALQALSEVL